MVAQVFGHMREYFFKSIENEKLAKCPLILRRWRRVNVAILTANSFYEKNKKKKRNVFSSA